MGRTLKRVWAVTLLTMISAPSLFAQEPNALAVNLSVGSSPQIGVTVQVSDAVALRPTLNLSWDKRTITNPFGPATQFTFTQVGFGLGVLFARRANGAIRPYAGASGGLSFESVTGPVSFRGDGHTVNVAGLFGVRARVVSRVYMFGELAVLYSAVRDQNSHSDGVSLGTTPLGVMIYLR